MGEKLPFGDKMKTKEPPFLCTTAHAMRTAATKADTQRSGHFSGFSRNISRHLGSNGLHRFSVCITSLQSFSPFTLICPHPDPQLRRLDPENKRDTLLCEQQ